MSKMTGVIAAVRRDGKGFMIEDSAGNPIWYSAFRADALGGATNGDTVTFTVKVKENPKDPLNPFHNIVGTVQVDGNAGEAPATVVVSGPMPAAAAVSAVELPEGYLNTKGYLNKISVFPVPITHPDYQYVRRAALECAVKQYNDDDSVANTLEIAVEFEKYLAGEDVAEEIEKIKAELEG